MSVKDDCLKGMPGCVIVLEDKKSVYLRELCLFILGAVPFTIKTHYNIGESNHASIHF